VQDFKEIYLIGYSGHGRVLCEAALRSGKKVLGYFEKIKSPYNPFSLKYLGAENDCKNEFYLKNFFAIGIGDNKLRKLIYDRVKKRNGRICTIFHPTAIISSSASIGEGTFANSNAIINSGAVLGCNTIINTSSIVEHDCIVGSDSHVAPGAILCGNVEIGNNTFIGAGAIIIEGTKLGSNVIVGAGSVVTKDVEDNSIIKGNPAKK